MQHDLKVKVTEHAKQWAAANKMSQNDLAKHSKVNAGYVSNMLRGIFSTVVDDKEVMISDRWFYQLADSTGFQTKKQYWGPVKTVEFEMMIHELNVAKNDSRVITIINNTGLGKTFTVDRFCMMNPLHTYKITASSMHRVRDILYLLAEALGVPISKYTSYHNYTIALHLSITSKLKELKMQGHKPIIIIDEAENLKLHGIQWLKGMYDAIVGYASIVLIGTTQLTDTVHKLAISNKPGAPQFLRRIKAGIKVIPTTNDFAHFFQKFKIEDKGLRQLLVKMCSNYGELHDYLEPALREADELGKPLTEDLFRLIHNIPKI